MSPLEKYEFAAMALDALVLSLSGDMKVDRVRFDDLPGVAEHMVGTMTADDVMADIIPWMFAVAQLRLAAVAVG